MILGTDDSWDLLDELDAESSSVIRTKCQPIVRETQSESDGGVPTMWSRDERVIDVGQCRGDAFSAERRDHVSVIGHVNAVRLIDTKGSEHRKPAFVQVVGEVSHHFTVVSHRFRTMCARLA